MAITPTTSSNCCISIFCCPCILVETLVSKVWEVAGRALESYLFWGIVLIGAFCKFTAVVLTGGLAIKGVSVYLFLGALLVAFYIYHNWSELRQEATQIFRLIENWACEYNWISEIVPGKLYLSGLPRKNFGDIETLKTGKNIKRVISVNELHELNKKTIPVEPVTPKDWQEHAIEQSIAEVVDHQGVPASIIHKKVEEIHRTKGAVLVHCYSGKGRSATIVAGYLLKYCGLPTVADAKAHLKRIRPQVSINAAQTQTLTEFFHTYVKKGA